MRPITLTTVANADKNCSPNDNRAPKPEHEGSMRDSPRAMGQLTSALSLGRRRGTFGPVFTPTLLAVFHTCRVECSTDYVIAHARQVLYSAAANQDNGVLLKRVPFSGDVGRNLHPVCHTDTRHLSQGGIGLLWGDGTNLNTNAKFLRASGTPVHPILQGVPHKTEGRRPSLFRLTRPPLSNELIRCWHSFPNLQ